MTYRVKEIFATLQGEGARTGRAAVFLRFSGCNLWDGDPEHRTGAACRFCDTDFVSTDGQGGGEFSDPESLADAVERAWMGGRDGRCVVVTGGEPTLQLDDALVRSLHDRGFDVAVETNGTGEVPEGVDWVCVSPKAGARWVRRSGQELKLVWPQGFDLAELERLPFENFFLQPMDDPDPVRSASNVQEAVRICLERPRWRLSLQTHKLIGIP